MARYTYNSDKYCGTSDIGLYNSVLNTEFSNEGAEPLTVQEVKDWGKIEQDTDDTLIEELITAAREVLEDFTAIGFITRTITAVIYNSNGGFHLPYGPVTNDPEATDMDGNDITLTYQLGRVNSPYGEMQIVYEGGYAVLPKKFKTAIKEQFLFMYENRGESNVGLSPMAKQLMEPVRKVI